MIHVGIEENKSKNPEREWWVDVRINLSYQCVEIVSFNCINWQEHDYNKIYYLE